MVTASVGVPVTEKRRCVMLPEPHRAVEGERMAGARLFLVGRADPDVVGKARGDPLEHREAGGVDAVVVGEQDAHQADGISRVAPPI